MASIQSLGIGSGVLTSDIVDKIIAAERKAADARIESKLEAVNVRISAYGTLQSSISSLQSAVSSLSVASSVTAKKTSSSDESTVKATASSLASAGSYAVEVTQTAQAQQLVSGTYSSLTSSIGTGTLTFRFGTTTYDTDTDTYSGFSANPEKGSKTLTIDSSNNSLTGLRDAINNANMGVTATIIDNGSGYQLSISSSSTGKNNSLEITASDSDLSNTDTNGISAFTFSSASTNLTQASAARDSSIKLNGVTITRSSNLVTGAINGVTLNLQQSNLGKTVTIGIEADTSSVITRVQAVVDAYNEIATQYTELTKYDPDTRKGGALLGDSTLRNMMNQVRSLMTGLVPGLEGGSVRSLVDLGISTNKDTGQMSLDTDVLSAKLTSNASDVMAAFSTRGLTSDSLVKFISNSAVTAQGNYAVNVTQLATQGTFSGAGVVAASTIIDADNDTFKINVNGNQSATITLTQGTYTTAALIQEIQTQINSDANLKAANVGVTVAFDSSNNRIGFTSTLYGSASSVAISAIDTSTAATLGLFVGSGTSGQNVAGTINGITATGIGQRLTSGETGSGSAGISVDVLGGSTGSRGTVSFVRGVASRMNSLLTSMLSSTGSLTYKTESLNEQITQIEDEKKKLELRISKQQERLQSQFSSYDTIITRLNSTADFLTQNFSTKKDS